MCCGYNFIDNHFCLQTSRYFSLEFKEEVKIRAFLSRATAHRSETMIFFVKSSFSDYENFSKSNPQMFCDKLNGKAS